MAAPDYDPRLIVGEHCAVPNCGALADVCVRGRVAVNCAIRYVVCCGHEAEMWAHIRGDYGLGPGDLQVGHSIRHRAGSP